MKGSELMIGDIVAVNNTPLQIAALGTAKAGFLNAKGEMFYHYYDNIAPIPLTAEILEKNGEFGKTVIGETIYRLGGEDYCVRKIGERYSFIRCAECGASWWLFDICHVHELQHTLKLCRIDKNIEL